MQCLTFKETTTMPLTVTPIEPDRLPAFAAEISGIDLRHAGEAEIGGIVAALDTYAVVVFRDQPLTGAEHLAFSAKLGPLEPTRYASDPRYAPRLDLRLADVSNIGVDSRVMAKDNRRWMSLLGNRMWHSDASFKATPAKYSLLAAYVLPEWGGETEFADQRAAYDALSPRLQAEIEDLVAEHDVFHSRRVLGFADFLEEEQRALPPVPQAVVRIHPGSRRKSLYLGSHAGSIHGMSVPEGRMLLNDLTDHATRPEFVHTHHWRVGDLVIWDNRCTLHRGRLFDATQPRDLRRTTITDDGPTVEQKRRMAG